MWAPLADYRWAQNLCTPRAHFQAWRPIILQENFWHVGCVNSEDHLHLCIFVTYAHICLHKFKYIMRKINMKRVKYEAIF